MKITATTTCKLLATVLIFESNFNTSGVVVINSPASPPYFSPLPNLIEQVSEVFSGLPDSRGKSNNRKYEMKDAALSAFSVFFLQNPSFLSSQINLQKGHGKNNATSIFGVHQIPSDNQIRNLLDPVPPDTLFPLMANIGDELYRQGRLEAFRSVNDTLLIAFDGTNFFCSDKISCPCCSQYKLSNGRTQYRHTVVTPSNSQFKNFPD